MSLLAINAKTCDINKLKLSTKKQIKIITKRTMSASKLPAAKANSNLKIIEFSLSE
jgi:hypothetical protein